MIIELTGSLYPRLLKFCNEVEKMNDLEAKEKAELRYVG